MRALRLLIVFAVVGGVAPAAAAREARPDAVVAIVDTGINPYHDTFADDSPRAYRHPSTYIDGYPKDAQALSLSLDEPSFEKAFVKDCKRVWARVEPGKLYWVPGTKIAGAITFGPQGPAGCGSWRAMAGYIFDWYGHGTMTASRAASREYGACRSCRIVAIQPMHEPATGEEGFTQAVDFAGENASWIDVQSNSWGPVAPVWDPTNLSGVNLASSELIRAVERAARSHLAFWASGNGAATRGGVAGHPAFLQPHMTPSAITVGAHDSGYVTTWHGFPPHVISDGCASWAAETGSTTEARGDVGSGTSAATPYAAGGAAEILLEARRILGDDSTGVDGGVVARGRRGLVARGPLADGKLTLEEWKRLLFVTATPRPEGQHEDGPACDPVQASGLWFTTPVKWSDVPEDFPEYVNTGYGAVDDAALRLAAAVLTGRGEAPDRSEVDAYFEHERAIREATHEVYTTP
ncbi:MAG TPA: S8 family serine peptidase [Actinomycetota bacterium]|nr:S8 family serine peptidase [Actinomycetota bacterium]